MDAKRLIAILEDAGYEPQRTDHHSVSIVVDTLLTVGSELCLCVLANAESNGDLTDAVDTVAQLADVLRRSGSERHWPEATVLFPLGWPPDTCPWCRSTTVYETTAVIARSGQPSGPDVPVRSCTECEFIEEITEVE